MSGKRIIPRERLDFVERLYLAGKARRTITRRVAKKFSVTERQARNYIARVEAKLAALPKPPPEATFHRVESMLLDAFSLARRTIRVVKWVDGEKEESRIFPAPETGTMVNAAWRLAELHGIVTQKADVTSNGETIGVLPTDPRWTELQREHLGAARQGVSDEARPDGDADPLASK